MWLCSAGPARCPGSPIALTSNDAVGAACRRMSAHPARAPPRRSPSGAAPCGRRDARPARDLASAATSASRASGEPISPSDSAAAARTPESASRSAPTSAGTERTWCSRPRMSAASIRTLNEESRAERLLDVLDPHLARRADSCFADRPPGPAPYRAARRMSDALGRGRADAPPVQHHRSYTRRSIRSYDARRCPPSRSPIRSTPTTLSCSTRCAPARSTVGD